ncbi:hypothetical protein COY05_03545 [Candidatus Peregrinibacteria bacterium CG_4_10_14_0_2_um_filter_38_24]|nr:MAG: hypothetical protein COY05_03545 [Candidatus Peregrinibacteria bacterium CG_4_10_14_0_2_um_filter_38_24]
MQFVSNSSPLIFLAKLNFLELLAKDQILIPSGVHKELLAKESAEKDRLIRFFNKKNITILKSEYCKIISKSLGKGEIEVINLAVDHGIPHVLMDDKRARSFAKIQDLQPHGILWIVLRAYRNKGITKAQARDLIYGLPSVGFRIDQEFLFQVLKKLD